MEKLNFRYSELDKQTQNTLKEIIIKNWIFSYKVKKLPFHSIESMENAVNELFSINNTGIDLDIYPYMNY